MDEKIDLSGVFSLAYIKKSRYTGSFYSMRYVLDLARSQRPFIPALIVLKRPRMKKKKQNSSNIRRRDWWQPSRG